MQIRESANNRSHLGDTFARVGDGFGGNMLYRSLVFCSITFANLAGAETHVPAAPIAPGRPAAPQASASGGLPGFQYHIAHAADPNRAGNCVMTPVQGTGTSRRLPPVPGFQNFGFTSTASAPPAGKCRALTAAHCLVDGAPRWVETRSQVRIQSSVLGPEAILVEVELHPSYFAKQREPNPSDRHHPSDIAIVTLPEAACKETLPLCSKSDPLADSLAAVSHKSQSVFAVSNTGTIIVPQGTAVQVKSMGQGGIYQGDSGGILGKRDANGKWNCVAGVLSTGENVPAGSPSSTFTYAAFESLAWAESVLSPSPSLAFPSMGDFLKPIPRAVRVPF